MKQAVRAGKRQTVVAADRARQAALEEEALESSQDRLLAGGLEGFAQQDEARGMVGNGQRVTISAIAEIELALEVS